MAKRESSKDQRTRRQQQNEPGRIGPVKKLKNHGTDETYSQLTDEQGGRQSDGTVSAAPETNDPAEPEGRAKVRDAKERRGK